MHDKAPSVSVIIPTYNRAHTVARALRSVLNQTHQDLEIIVVDDASTDDTEGVVDNFIDSRIHYLRHEKNLGGSAARNTGIRVARGKYIAFLDSDDEWLPEKIDRQVAFFQDQSPEWGGVYCMYYADGLSSRSAYSGSFIDKVLLKQAACASGSTLMVLREVTETVGLWDESFRRHQDIEWLVRVMRHYKVGVIPQPMVLLHRSAASKGRASSVEESKTRLFKVFSEEIRKLDSKTQRKIRGNQWHELSLLFLEEGSWRKGLAYAGRSIANKRFRLKPKEVVQFILFSIDGVMGTSLYRSLRHRWRHLP